MSKTCWEEQMPPLASPAEVEEVAKLLNQPGRIVGLKIPSVGDEDLLDVHHLHPLRDSQSRN